MYGRQQLQIGVPFTGVVKKLVIANVAIWLVAVVILQGIILGYPYIYEWFGLVPIHLLTRFWIWQPFTYMFLHSDQIFHILFNMLMLWLFGSELERRWGSRFFFAYYMVSGVGAGLLYMLGIGVYAFASSNVLPLQFPVVGASGAVFGLMLAYGILFGERTIYFMMMFPMKAKYFVMILGGIEVVSLLNTGVSGQVANLAHLGGLVAGYLFLLFWSGWQRRQRQGGGSSKHRRRLKLVVDNERDQQGDGPRYWN